MIFEQHSEHSGDLIAYKWDFGVPVTFMTAADDIPFTIGDEIRFELRVPEAIKKVFVVDTEDFSFDLSFTQAEADMLANSGRNAFIYSIKQYSARGEFLDTIMNGKLILQETIKWED